MAVQSKITVEEFEAFVDLPENADKLFEYVGGEIIEVPSNPFSSKIATRFSTYIGMYLLQNDIGHLTGESGGYMVSGERYAPDVAFISYARQPALAKQGYNPNPPELAIEVVSPSDSMRLLTDKVANYLAALTLVWVVYPDEKMIKVYAHGQPTQTLGLNDTLDGGTVLPGFKLKVNDILGAEPGPSQ